MKKCIVALIALMLLAIISFSQNTPTLFSDKIIVIGSDTSFIIPSWRLKEANKRFMAYEFSLENIAQLELLVKEYKEKDVLQSIQIKDLTSVIGYKDSEIKALNDQLILKDDQSILLNEQLKAYKKKNRVLKGALGVSFIGLVGITIFAISAN